MERARPLTWRRGRLTMHVTLKKPTKDGHDRPNRADQFFNGSPVAEEEIRKMKREQREGKEDLMNGPLIFLSQLVKSGFSLFPGSVK